MGIIGFGLWLNCPQYVDTFEIENPGLKHDFRQIFSFKKGDSRKISRSLRETLSSSTLYNVPKIMAPFSKTILATKRLRYIDHSMGSDLNADRRVSHSSHCVEGLKFWSYNGVLGIFPPGTRVGDFLYNIGDSNIELVVRPDWCTNPISGCAVDQPKYIRLQLRWIGNR